jgi:hypothetical protein
VGQPDEIAEWLATQIGTDEAMLVDGGSCRCEDGGPQRPDCADRVAFDVAAKRAILDQYEAAAFHADLPEGVADGRDPDERDRDEAVGEALEHVVRHLATAYAGRDGYDESWRPA